MKRLYLLLAVVLAAANLRAQSVLESPVSISGKGLLLEEALYQLSDQNGVSLSFSNDILPAHRLDVDIKDKSLAEALDEFVRHGGGHVDDVDPGVGGEGKLIARGRPGELAHIVVERQQFTACGLQVFAQSDGGDRAICIPIPTDLRPGQAAIRRPGELQNVAFFGHCDS